MLGVVTLVTKNSQRTHANTATDLPRAAGPSLLHELVHRYIAETVPGISRNSLDRIQHHARSDLRILEGLRSIAASLKDLPETIISTAPLGKPGNSASLMYAQMGKPAHSWLS